VHSAGSLLDKNYTRQNAYVYGYITQDEVTDEDDYDRGMHFCNLHFSLMKPGSISVGI
jgi:hypothetical protein